MSNFQSVQNANCLTIPTVFLLKNIFKEHLFFDCRAVQCICECACVCELVSVRAKEKQVEILKLDF